MKVESKEYIIEDKKIWRDKMALNGLKGFLGISEDVTTTASDEDTYYEKEKEEATDENGISKMILVEPRAFSEANQIADHLKKRNTVVVNLRRVTPDQAKRIIDFLSGTLYAIKGDLQKLGGGVFLCTPNNVKVDGKISDDNPKAMNKGIKRDKEEDEFNW